MQTLRSNRTLDFFYLILFGAGVKSPISHIHCILYIRPKVRSPCQDFRAFQDFLTMPGFLELAKNSWPYCSSRPHWTSSTCWTSWPLCDFLILLGLLNLDLCFVIRKWCIRSSLPCLYTNDFEIPNFQIFKFSNFQIFKFSRKKLCILVHMSIHSQDCILASIHFWLCILVNEISNYKYK